MNNEIACILLAAGSGTRAGFDQKKQFVRIAGKTLIEHSLEAIRRFLPDALILVMAPVDSMEKVERLVSGDPRVMVAAGGASRQASTLRGLRALKPHHPRHVLIHDAARPFVEGRIIQDVLVALEDHDGVDVAIPTSDTIIIERDGFIEQIPRRSHLLRGQTPQAFRFEGLLGCYESIDEAKLDHFTDDCGIFLACNPNAKIRIVQGSEENIKVTHPIDMILADEMFRLRASALSMDQPGVELRDKRVLIFGGTRGIGHAMAEIMRAGGAHVLARSRENGCDITSAQSVEHAFSEAADQLGGIDIVVNAAGLLQHGRLDEQSWDAINDQVDVNLKGTLHIARAAYPWLKAAQGSLLLFASSSYTRGRADYVTYSATKAAIVNLTQGLSEEWANDGIRVNCIIPGRTDTDMRRNNFKNEVQTTLASPYDVGLTAVKALSTAMTSQMVRC
ncbi:MAG: SDR family NAD(P)-dependent oxidoreductase [Chakrabartia sp.]